MPLLSGWCQRSPKGGLRLGVDCYSLESSEQCFWQEKQGPGTEMWWGSQRGELRDSEQPAGGWAGCRGKCKGCVCGGGGCTREGAIIGWGDNELGSSRLCHSLQAALNSHPYGTCGCWKTAGAHSIPTLRGGAQSTGGEDSKPHPFSMQPLGLMPAGSHF